jgi:hypothetical protein
MSGNRLTQYRISCTLLVKVKNSQHHWRYFMDFRALFDKAYEAGLAAGKAAIPATMVVGSPSTPLGNDIDPSKPVYFVNEGCCGFAWVNVSPGNCRFANWLKKNGLARKAYGGGVDIWCREFGQSMTRKEAWADAFADVCRDAGVPRCYAGSRMD